MTTRPSSISHTTHATITVISTAHNIGALLGLLRYHQSNLESVLARHQSLHTWQYPVTRLGGAAFTTRPSRDALSTNFRIESVLHHNSSTQNGAINNNNNKTVMRLRALNKVIVHCRIRRLEFSRDSIRMPVQPTRLAVAAAEVTRESENESKARSSRRGLS